jgi:hypothetical protein
MPLEQPHFHLISILSLLLSGDLMSQATEIPNQHGIITSPSVFGSCQSQALTLKTPVSMDFERKTFFQRKWHHYLLHISLLFVFK